MKTTEHEKAGAVEPVVKYSPSDFGESVDFDLPDGANLILVCVNYYHGDSPRTMMLPHQLYRKTMQKWLSEKTDIRGSIKSISVYPIRSNERIEIPLKDI